MTRYFLDTEFLEAPGVLDLISLGLVCEDGRTYYAQSCEFDANRANPWVVEHVLPHLQPCPAGQTKAQHYGRCLVPGCTWAWRDEMRDEVRAFVGATIPEFIGYYCAYDWVALCWLFGTMVDLPQGWPMLCYDLRQWLDMAGLQQVSQPDEMPHQALSDAQWIAATFDLYHQRAHAER